MFQSPNITSLPIAAFVLPEETTVKTSVHILTYTDDGPIENTDCVFTVDPAGAPYEMEQLDVDPIKKEGRKHTLGVRPSYM